MIQKLYQSRQASAFSGEENALAIQTLGFYSDLQSVRSEDALTWSVFGPLIYGPAESRLEFVIQLLSFLRIEAGPQEVATLWLWRRVPHPDTLVPGDPEVDFGIQTRNFFLLGEAKWCSKVGRQQGKS